jgi:repressor LexA
MGRTPAGETRQRVLGWIRERLLAGRPPTVREVQQAFGFRAVQTAREHLEALVREGRLAKDEGRARGYRLPGGRGVRPPVLVPLLGRVPAGALDTAVEDAEGHVAVQARHAASDLFALRVRGDSMTDAGILPGDIVVVHRGAAVQSGDVVVALVEDEATVKRLRLRGRAVELHPANPSYAVLRPDPRGLRLLGKVIEVRRHLEEPRWRTR